MCGNFDGVHRGSRRSCRLRGRGGRKVRKAEGVWDGDKPEIGLGGAVGGTVVAQAHAGSDSMDLKVNASTTHAGAASIALMVDASIIHAEFFSMTSVMYAWRSHAGTAFKARVVSSLIIRSTQRL